MEKLNDYFWLSSDEIDITSTGDTGQIEIPVQEVEKSDTNELQELTKIREAQEIETSYVCFFVIMVLGGFVVYKLLKFFESFLW